MVIDDLDIEGVSVMEPEAQAPLLVDPDAPLPSPVAAQRLQSIRRRNAQVLESCRGVELDQSPDRPGANVGRKAPALPRRVEPFRIGVCERPDHRTMLNMLFITVKGANDVRHLRPLRDVKLTGPPGV